LPGEGDGSDGVGVARAEDGGRPVAAGCGGECVDDAFGRDELVALEGDVEVLCRLVEANTRVRGVNLTGVQILGKTPGGAEDTQLDIARAAVDQHGEHDCSPDLRDTVGSSLACGTEVDADAVESKDIRWQASCVGEPTPDGLGLRPP
jgi:hypothetical protein